MKQTSQLIDKSIVRLDRWLWAARFFKTRSLAKQAIDGGKIRLNNQRTKPGKSLHGEEILQIRKGTDLYTIKVTALASKRGPAKVAQTLYCETEESQKSRKAAAEARRSQTDTHRVVNRRPDKRQRRKIHQFKQQNTD